MLRTIAVSAFLGLLVLGGCASKTVMSDFDRNSDFESYRTFGFIPYNDKLDPSSPLNKRSMRVRIEDAIRDELESRDYRFIDNGNPDIRIAFHASAREQIMVDHYGYSSWQGPGQTDISRYKEGTLVIDFVDPDQKQLVWRGWAVGVIIGPEDTNEQISKTVKRIIDKYPPKE
ncbi:MAG TPA: DUF4136 domain-containing protein [candidate division Zixibacteria bacterium]|nr:DUF4136 domain-containing protein [candidate division Zixibacteria bacterium]HEQ98102.1 DUF4136 domain-containing protein [candidate division Zixibacteria bacterium]